MRIDWYGTSNLGYSFFANMHEFRMLRRIASWEEEPTFLRWEIAKGHSIGKDKLMVITLENGRETFWVVGFLEPGHTLSFDEWDRENYRA